MWVRSLSWEDPLEKGMSTSVFLPGESHGQRILAGSGPSVQFSSITQSCLTLCNPMDCGRPGLPVHHQFFELLQTHVH